MLRDSDAFASFSVDDLEAARRFYGEVLGLDVDLMEMGLLRVRHGGGTVMVYPKDDHAPAVFTVLNFPVDDIDAAVDGLRARGVEMLRYDHIPGADDRGIHRGQGPEIAWFADPAGNVLSVLRIPKE
ncbi:MAG TPA: VOC family protein [Miltoncostaeaceae bacterium]|nr:VOC family protein [Miltoncostaeaceae bacterium]